MKYRLTFVVKTALREGLLAWCLAGFVVLIVAGLTVFAEQGAATKVRANKNFHPGQPWLDSNGVHINAHGFCVLDFGGRHYWYGAHKIEGKTEDEKNEAGVRCYVSDDLMNWQDQGLVLSVFAPDAHPDLAEAFILDRPKVICNEATKKFILYFKLYPPKSKGGKSGKDYAWVGVATSAQPTGPFEYKGYFLGNHSEFGTGDFAIFTDKDGAVYHVAVRKPDKALIYARLSEDGLKPIGEYKELKGVTLKTEAPAFFRRGEKFYLLGSGTSGWQPNPARIFVADRFTGPYQELPNPCQGVNPINNLGPDKTFGGQSTYVYPVAGRQDAWIAMFDINQPDNPIESGYIWLPLEFEGGKPVLRWRDEWNLSVFADSKRAVKISK
jgi:beta-xylosidase